MDGFSQVAKKPRVDGGVEAGGVDAKKNKSCTKFFSTNGCMYWSTCNFSHSIPPSNPTFIGPPTGGHSGFNSYGGPPQRDFGAVRKTKLCNKYLTAEGCPFGDKCNFAHGDEEIQQSRETSKRSYDQMQGGGYGYGGRPDMGIGASQATANATMTIRADAVGIIIGKGGMHVRHINATSGARVKIAEPDNPKSTTRVLEMSGTLDQIQMAQQMVQQLLHQFQAQTGPMPEQRQMRSNPGNIKTKLCANFTAGNCKYGDKCHFAHGEEELRQYDAAGQEQAAM